MPYAEKDRPDRRTIRSFLAAVLALAPLGLALYPPIVSVERSDAAARPPRPAAAPPGDPFGGLRPHWLDDGDAHASRPSERR